MPAAGAPAPACWIGQAGREEFDAAVAVPVVLPVDKRRYRLAGLVFAGEWSAWVVGPVLDGSEQGL